MIVLIFVAIREFNLWASIYDKKNYKWDIRLKFQEKNK